MQLYLPEQRSIPGVDTRPGPLRSWLKGLPYIETLKSTELIVERLQDINHQALDAKTRLQLLEAFRDSYVRLHDMLRDQARQQLGLAQTQSLRLLTELTEQMGYGYKYALRDVIAENPRWGRAKLLAEAANYAQQFMVLALLCRYQSYQPVAEQAWKECGELVRFAETEAIPATRDSGFPYSSGELHLFAAYRQLTMLRLADPYRLPSGLIWEAYRYLAQQVGKIELLKNFDGEMPMGVYGIILDHEPYESKSMPTSGVERSAWRGLDARDFLQQAQADLDRLRGGTPPERIGFSSHLTNADAVQLLGRMLGQWTHNYERKSPRISSQTEVELAPGLDAAYYFLNDGTAFDPEQYVTAEDDDNIDFSVTGLRTGRARVQDFRLVSCATRNRSGGGVALQLSGQEGFTLRVGQLLLLNAPGGPTQSNPAEWLIGVTRWLVNHPGRGIEMGVQYIARDCTPVVVRPATGLTRHYQPALKNAIALANGQRLDILIVPKGLYRTKGVLELQYKGSIAQIQCGQLIEVGTGFERFSYEVIA